MKKVIAVVFLVGIIGVLGFAYVPGFIDSNQSKNSAENVLDNVIDQEYEKAFESVHFYDIASDIEPTISYEDAKIKWVERVKFLKEKGIYVVSYNQLRVRLDDTYPVGTVNLVIMENGKEVVRKDVHLWFGKSEDGWKLGNIDNHLDDKEDDWEKALSGSMEGS